MAVIQNRCLRVVSGGYKGTPIEVLHAETMVPPIQEYLDQLQAKARIRLRTGGQAAFIKKQCKKIAIKLRKRGTPPMVDTPGRQKDQWALSITTGVTDTPPPQQPPPPPWLDQEEEITQSD